MQSAHAYLPIDRRRSLATGSILPEFDRGAILFADISGFTHLTNTLVDNLGPRRGAEAATHHLNTVYAALVHTIHAAGGSVVSFSGDGMLCWFPAAGDLAVAAQAALRAAQGLHAQMAQCRVVAVGPGQTVELGLKVALAAGDVRRVLVGDPAIQLFDLLAGLPVDQVGAAEPLAGRGETVAAYSLVALVGAAAAVRWRRTGADGQEYALLDLGDEPADGPTGAGQADGPAELPAESVRPWLFPAVYARLAAGQERFLAELRPGVALFLRINELDLMGEPQAAALLDGYVQWVQRVLEREDALLVQVTTGDKGTYLYAAFGALVLHDDDALRAASAALALLQPPAQIAAIGPVHLGLAQGRMRVGAYGSDERRTFGVQGAAVNLAARLMMVAPPNGVVVEPEVARRIEDRYLLHDMGPVALKGLAAPLRLATIIGLRPREQAGAPETTLRLVGRAAEMALLAGCAAQARAGSGCRVQLEGAAGIGKSAMLRALAATLVEQGWRVATGDAHSTQRHTPYAGLGRLLWSLVGLSHSAQAGASGAVEALTEWAAAANPAWAARLPLLREVLGVPLPESALTAGLDPETRRQAITALVVDMVAYAAVLQPTALLVDDRQWLDEASAAVLAAIADALPGVPILLVVAQRGADPEADDAAAPQRLLMKGLDAAALLTLAEQQLAATLDPLAAQLVNALVQGNPLVLVQVLDALQAAGRLARRGDRIELASETLELLRAGRALVASETGWQFAESGLEIGSVLGLPESLHGLMLARVDRLPETAKLTLKVASVVGRVFDLDVVARAHPLAVTVEQVVADLAQLERHNLLLPVHEAAPPSYRFEHNLTQELVYQTLLSTQQQELHGRVAYALEALRPDAVVGVAQHFYAADLGQPDVRARALVYLDRAVARLRAEFANETALRFLDQALGLEDRWVWRKGRVEVLHILGRRDEEAAALDALAAGSGVAAVEHGLLESRYCEAVNAYGRAHAAAARALDLAERTGDRASQAACLVQLARVAGREGDYAAEGRYYLRARHTLAHDTADPVALEIAYGLGIVAQQQGDYEQAENDLRQALDLARARASLAEEARILTALGIVARMARRFGDAYAWTERSLAIRRLVGDRAGESASLMSLAQVVIHGLGDYGRGRDLLEEALAMTLRLRDRWSQGIVLNELGIVYLLVGGWDQAERYLLDALAICGEIGADAGAAHVLCNLGQVQRGQDRLDAAAASFARGYAYMEEMQDPQLQAQYWSELALLALAQGDAAAAQTWAGQAVTALRELDLEVMTTADLCTLAEACVRLGQEREAAGHARAAFDLLEACQGEGPDYPQRDYYRVAQVLAPVDRPSAEAALAAAIALLQTRAQRIGDDTLRRSFLTAIPIHAAIVAAAPPATRRA